QTLFSRPAQAYTRKLVSATPTPASAARQNRCDRDTRGGAVAVAPALLSVEGVRKEYPIPTEDDPYRMVKVVKDVSFSIRRGECVGLVGESGSGKSTLGRIICRLIDHSEGTIHFDGAPIGDIRSLAFSRSPLRKEIQFVFQ